MYVFVWMYVCASASASSLFLPLSLQHGDIIIEECFNYNVEVKVHPICIRVTCGQQDKFFSYWFLRLTMLDGYQSHTIRKTLPPDMEPLLYPVRKYGTFNRVGTGPSFN